MTDGVIYRYNEWWKFNDGDKHFVIKIENGRMGYTAVQYRECDDGKESAWNYSFTGKIGYGSISECRADMDNLIGRKVKWSKN